MWRLIYQNVPLATLIPNTCVCGSNLQTVTVSSVCVRESVCVCERERVCVCVCSLFQHVLGLGYVEYMIFFPLE